MHFLKEHLAGNDYNWAPEAGNYLFTREPARKQFDRYNGNQLLYMINFFGSSVGRLSVDDGKRIEDLLLNQLPLEVKSEIAVLNWLKGKYLYYWN